MFALKDRLLRYSILLSVICITLTIIINIEIAQEYLRVDGKTQALFGIKEILQFGYQYYVVVPCSISLVLAIIGAYRAVYDQGIIKYSALIFSIVAILLVFARIWRLFI